MSSTPSRRRLTFGTALAAALAATLATAGAAPLSAQRSQARTVTPTQEVTLSAGTGQVVRLSGTMADVFIADDRVADVQVRSGNQIYIFGKARGETTVHAVDRNGRVIYATRVRVGQNFANVDEMIQAAMPEAQIRATPMNGMILLTGTVAQPADAEEAERLVQAMVGEGTQVLSRLRTATPQQVMLQVKIAEVSRTLLRELGVNLLTRDRSNGGFVFGVGRGNPGTITDITGGGIDPVTGRPPIIGTNYGFSAPTSPTGTAIGLAGRVFGLDVLSQLQLNENDGLVTTLAEPTLTALSGETASFLAGGEFPIPVSQSLGAVSIEYKQYGVGLAFSPIVLENGRISMRVRPEVSELSVEGSIRLNGFDVPAITTRRTETTVELGSGQSFMIAGLLRNNNTNSVDRAPGLGNLPILGALFRSTRFRRAETELVIIVTPYLVNPVSANQIALPTDGHRRTNDFERFVVGTENSGVTGERRPMPQAGPPRTVTPGMTTSQALPPPSAPAPASRPSRVAAAVPTPTTPSPQPGFDF